MVKMGKIRFQGRGSERRAQEVGRKPEIRNCQKCRPDPLGRGHPRVTWYCLS